MTNIETSVGNITTTHVYFRLIVYKVYRATRPKSPRGDSFPRLRHDLLYHVVGDRTEGVHPRTSHQTPQSYYEYHFSDVWRRFTTLGPPWAH